MRVENVVPYRLPRKPGELESLHLERVDRTRLLQALSEEARLDGLAELPPGDLVPFGRWLHGDEDPAVRRYLVAPSGPRWTTVLSSATDWHHEACARLAQRLGCRAVHFMLQDGDVLALAAVVGPDHVIEHVTSTDHFDLPPPPAGHVERVARELLPLCREGTTVADVVAALTPPGAFDVEGRVALVRLAALCEIPEADAASSYRDALEEDGLTPRPELARHAHLAFRESLDDDGPPTEDDAEETPGDAPDNVLRFPGPRRD